MRTVVIGAVIAVVCVFSVVAAVGAAEQIGVIDLGYIMDESKAGRAANDMLAQLVEQRQEALKPFEDRLEQLNDKMTNDEHMSEEERNETIAAFNEAIQQYTEAVNAFESEIQRIHQEIRNGLLSEISFVVKMVGDESNLDLIVDTTSVYYYRVSHDISDQIIEAYDLLWDEAQQLDTNE